jgi:hypothetical protein
MITRSVVGRYASKTELVATFLFLLDRKIYLERLGLQVLFVAPGDVIWLNPDRAAESKCASASLLTNCAHSVGPAYGPTFDVFVDGQCQL